VTQGTLVGVACCNAIFYTVRAAHLLHHQTSGNLDSKGAGHIDTLTLAEFQKLRPLMQLGYRIMHNPVFLLTVGDLFHLQA